MTLKSGRLELSSLIDVYAYVQRLACRAISASADLEM